MLIKLRDIDWFKVSFAYSLHKVQPHCEMGQSRISLSTPHLLATSVEIRMDRFLARNLVSAARRLFWDICPCRGTADMPRLRTISAVRSVLAHVEQKIMNELPAISFNMCTRYTSCNISTQIFKIQQTFSLMFIETDAKKRINGFFTKANCNQIL